MWDLHLSGKYIYRMGGNYFPYMACIIILYLVFGGRVDQGLSEMGRTCDKLEELANSEFAQFSSLSALISLLSPNTICILRDGPQK